MSRRRKNDIFAEAIVGLFMLAVLALLVYFTIVISGVDVLKGRQKVVANVAFDAVGGLKEHDNVMYRGTKVGGVEDVIVTPSNLTVRIEVDQSVVLRTSYRITVCSLSMLGGQFLMLEEGEGEVVDITAGLLHGEPPTDWMQDVSRIARNLNNLTSGEGLRTIITNIQAASESAKNIADRLERGEGTLGKLLSSDETIYNDAPNTVSDVKRIASRLERGEGTLGKLLSSDEKVYGDITNAVADARKMLANASEISERIKAGEGTVGKLLSSDAQLYEELRESVASFKKACDKIKLPDTLDKDIADITTGANKLVANLTEVSEKLKNGEGTLGKLTNNAEMYDEVQGLIKDVRQVLDNYRDTTPISTFGSLIMGGL